MSIKHHNRYTYLLCVCLMYMSGCTTIERHTGAAPYLDVGIGHQLDSSTDWYHRTERAYQCNNPQAHFEIGLEWKNTTLGYHHQSWYFCGEPFNNKAETYVDDVRLMHRFGGRK